MKCGMHFPEEIRSQIPEAQNEFKRSGYDRVVRDPLLNTIVLGLLGLAAACSTAVSYFKQAEPWWNGGGLPVGILAIICAIQMLSGAPEAEIRCTSRILGTLFSLYVALDYLTLAPGEDRPAWRAYFDYAAGIAFLFFAFRLWRLKDAEEKASESQA